MPLRKIIVSYFGQEVEILPFIRMCDEEMAEITRKCISIDKISGNRVAELTVGVIILTRSP